MKDLDIYTRENLEACSLKYDDLRADFNEFAQGMTDFQVEVFIANGEGPVAEFPAHAYRHLLAQVRPLIGEIRRVTLERERSIRKLDLIKCEKKGDWDLDSLELEYRIEEFDTDLKGKWSLYSTYERLLNHIRTKYGPFTNEDLQSSEPEYWKFRLAKQMVDSRHGAITGLGAGNLNSLRMAIMGSILPDSGNIIDDQVLLDPAAHFDDMARQVNRDVADQKKLS